MQMAQMLKNRCYFEIVQKILMGYLSQRMEQMQMIVCMCVRVLLGGSAHLRQLGRPVKSAIFSFGSLCTITHWIVMKAMSVAFSITRRCKDIKQKNTHKLHVDVF